MIRFSDCHAVDISAIDDDFTSELLSAFNGKKSHECLYEIECIFNKKVHDLANFNSKSFVAMWEVITACRRYPSCILIVE